MSLFISIKGMQSKVSASISNAEQEVPGHIVCTITQIAERTLRQAFQSFFFFWWGLLHGPQQGPDRMKEKKPIRLGKGKLLPKQKNPP